MNCDFARFGLVSLSASVRNDSRSNRYARSNNYLPEKQSVDVQFLFAFRVTTIFLTLQNELHRFAVNVVRSEKNQRNEKKHNECKIENSGNKFSTYFTYIIVRLGFFMHLNEIVPKCKKYIYMCIK